MNMHNFVKGIYNQLYNLAKSEQRVDDKMADSASVRVLLAVERFKRGVTNEDQFVAEVRAAVKRRRK